MTLNWTSQEIIIQSDRLLAGTLTIPEGDGTFPAIVLLGDGGLLDRDGNTLRGKFRLNLYRELAEYCTSLGFITLRYDKRGVGESEGEFERAGLWDAVNDAKAAITLLEAHSKVTPNQVIVMGHGEGCSVATALNEKRPVQGIILLAGGGEGLEELLQRQRDLIFAQLDDDYGWKGMLARKFELSQRAERKAQKIFQKILHTDKEIIRTNMMWRMPAKYFREHFNYNVQAGLQYIKCPVLAITGTKDFQSNPINLQRIPSVVQGEREIYVIQDMNHHLKYQKKPLSPLTYKKEREQAIDELIHEELLEHLTQWLRKYYKS